MTDNIVSFRPKTGGEAGDMTADQRRWFVRIEYRSDNGGEFQQHFVEELYEIAAIVEAGHHWDTIVEISVMLNRRAEENSGLTIEKARLL